MKRLIIITLLFSVLLSSCSKQALSTDPGTLFPTPTSYHLFAGDSTPIPPAATNANQTPLAPTVASIFNTYKENTPTPIKTRQPIASTAQPVSLNPYNGETESITIYGDVVNPNWQILTSDGAIVNQASTKFASSGNNSIEITPSQDFGMTLFAVSPTSTESYPRERVLGIEFKLNPGNSILETRDLGITIIGSNQYTYYAPGDTSVTNKVDPIFPETRLYYLGINQAIPPKTWVDVTVWLDNLIYDPIYKNVTGFYIKNDEGFRETFYIDDVRLIMLADGPTAAVDGQGTPAANKTAVPPVDNVTSVDVNIDLNKNVHEINPMIYGVTNALRDTLNDLRPGLNSWGGDTSSRYNWELGNAWNAGRAKEYRNTNLGNLQGSASDQLINQSISFNTSVRITLPTLGWVAKNSNPQTCSFPLADGSCGNADDASCINPGEIADPKLANAPSDVNWVMDWVKRMLVDRRYNIDVFALDNEPELWGVTHYDVHPKCTTYQEIYDKYVEYAEPLRALAPKAKLAGPVTSAWNFKSSQVSSTDSQNTENQELIPWFLDKVKQHDTQLGVSTIDVLDIHYLPAGVYNQEVDAVTAAHRLRSTRSLWDPTYIDESETKLPVNLINRMKDLIDKHYPGLELGISKWNFGADQNINGALAIADALGIFGREGVYYASYSDIPAIGSPAALAFKMYTNYDGRSGTFGDTSGFAESTNPNLISAFVSVDKNMNQVHLILINKHPKNSIQVKLNAAGFEAPKKAMLYRYSRENLGNIVSQTVTWPEDSVLETPPYSINHYIFTP